MCDGMHFCGPCSDEKVEAWAHGESHDFPKFGDEAQQWTAAHHRIERIVALEGDGQAEELERFPEWMWAEGRSHSLPKFPGGMFYEHGGKYRAHLVGRRRHVITSLMNNGDVAALQNFPEWHAALAQLGMKPVSDMTTLRRTVPMFSNRIKRGSRRGDLQFRRTKWVEPFGGAYSYFRRQMMGLVGNVGGGAIQGYRVAKDTRSGWRVIERSHVPQPETQPELAGVA